MGSRSPVNPLPRQGDDTATARALPASTWSAPSGCAGRRAWWRCADQLDEPLEVCPVPGLFRWHPSSWPICGLAPADSILTRPSPASSARSHGGPDLAEGGTAAVGSDAGSTNGGALSVGVRHSAERVADEASASVDLLHHAFALEEREGVPQGGRADCVVGGELCLRRETCPDLQEARRDLVPEVLRDGVTAGRRGLGHQCLRTRRATRRVRAALVTRIRRTYCSDQGQAVETADIVAPAALREIVYEVPISC